MTRDLMTDDERWAAVQARDKAFDGRFVTGVLTTGIYCRPSCAARHPLRANVRFFADGAAARRAGLRPCKRCLPDDVARAALSEAGRVTDAIYDAGFSGPSRFYDNMEGRMGMTASAWVGGGKGATIHWGVVPTSLGAMLVAATAKGVCRLSFAEGREALEERFPAAELVEGGEEFSALLKQVVDAVEAPVNGFDHIPIDVKGTAFQEAVWRELRKIPAGETRSYSDIAAAVGKPAAVRAAGSANGANNVAVLIPCHRVVRSDGSLGGYAYGLPIKEELLKRERFDVG